MQEIGGALRMGGGAKDCALVFLQHFEFTSCPINRQQAR